MDFYLAYGSNLNLQQMRWRCPTARVVGVTEIPDYELLFKGSKTGSYLTIEPRKGASVPVAVWAVTERDLAALDRYEGYPSFYYKQAFTLPVNGKQRRCFAYIMHEDRPFGMPSKSYVQACLEGYRAFQFDEKILKRAIKRTEEQL